MTLRTLAGKWIAALLLHLLVGCSTTYNDGTREIEAGNLSLAEDLLMRAIREGDNLPGSWNNLGVIYSRTNRLDPAIQSYTMGARYGNPISQANLRQLGKPVPAADLAASYGSTASIGADSQ